MHIVYYGNWFLDNSGKTDYPEPDQYNQSVDKALAWLKEQKQSFFIRDKEGLVLIEQGRFYGMGQVPLHADLSALDKIKNQLIEYPENEVMRSMIRNYAERYPHKVVPLEN
jgi:DNA polymerase III subunit epsilon